MREIIISQAACLARFHQGCSFSTLTRHSTSRSVAVGAFDYETHVLPRRVVCQSSGGVSALPQLVAPKTTDPDIHVESSLLCSHATSAPTRHFTTRNVSPTLELCRAGQPGDGRVSGCSVCYASQGGIRRMLCIPLTNDLYPTRGVNCLFNTIEPYKFKPNSLFPKPRTLNNNS